MRTSTDSVSSTGRYCGPNGTPGPAPVWLDASQLELALINLARNAVDAMPEGGQLTVRTSAIDLNETGQWIAVTVADTGEGMTPEVVRKAAEPFFTTKERGKGTGLGLSMVAGFAEQSGGRMQIESAPGQGTRITLVLPRGETDTIKPNDEADRAKHGLEPA